MPLRALMGFGLSLGLRVRRAWYGLNALAGIDGFWTEEAVVEAVTDGLVLMPLRALMGFGLSFVAHMALDALSES